MTLATTVLCLAGGFALLLAGADVLVRGASRLAILAGISPLVVGLTVVAYGTSAPELAVNIRAGLAGSGDLAVGNVVGSNQFNVLFILGASALAAPLIVRRRMVRLDVPLMVAVSVLAWAVSLDRVVGRIEGVILCAGAAAYTVFQIVSGRRDAAAEAAARGEGGGPKGGGAVLVSLVLVAAGVGALVLGADWLVKGACDVARRLGVGELLIGLTIVAGGTSLPEAATSIVAAVRGERDIAVGNVVGSNIFNVLIVLGAASAVTGGVAVAEQALRFDIPVMVAVAVACLPIFFTGERISRWEGVLFLGYYAAYVAYLVLAAKRHEALAPYGRALLWFVIPATALALALSVARSLGRRPVVRQD
jgi:cation:H+ antiporter